MELIFLQPKYEVLLTGAQVIESKWVYINIKAASYLLGIF